jgi:hypothetical protein
MWKTGRKGRTCRERDRETICARGKQGERVGHAEKGIERLFVHMENREKGSDMQRKR